MIRVDTSEIVKLAKAMEKYSRIFPKEKANAALRKAVRPMLAAAQIEAPVSFDGQTRVSLKHRKKGNAVNSYRQGGATRKDLRVKSVQAEGDELGRVLIGVSKKRGKVGWRTPFITKGTKERKTKKGKRTGRVSPNNFLQRAFDRTFPSVREAFARDYREAFIQWAKQTLPKGKI